MSLPFNGVLLSINLRPASGVRVRIFDVDNPDSESDELTSPTNPVVSGSDGRYSGWYDPLRGIDMVPKSTTMDYWAPRNPSRGDFTPVRRTRTVTIQVADPADTYNPTLDLQYRAWGGEYLIRHSGTPHTPHTVALPHVVNAEPVTPPLHLAVSTNVNGVPTALVRGADRQIWTLGEINHRGICSAKVIANNTMGLQPFIVVRNSDGRLELVGQHSSGALMNSRQISPGGDWSPLTSMGGAFSAGGALAAEVNSDGRIWVFARDSGGALLFASQLTAGGNWSEWQSLGGQIPSGGSISVIRSNSGELNIFYNGTDHQIWTLHQTGNGMSSWSPHIALGGAKVAGPLAVGRNENGALEVFAQGRGGDIWHKRKIGTNGWSNWETLGGVWVAGSLAVANHADGRLAAFVQGSDRKLSVISQISPNNGWGNWTNLGIPPGPQFGVRPTEPADPIRIGKKADGALMVLWRTPSGGLFTRSQINANGKWEDWQSLGELPPPSILLAPELNAATAHSNSVVLQWNNVNGATRYRVHWKAHGSSTIETAETHNAVTVFTVFGLENGREYEFWVVALNGCNTSPESNRLRATPFSKPDLVAGSVYGSEASPQANRAFKVSCVVTNTGTARSESCAYKFSRTGSSAAQDVGTIPALNPQQSYTAEWHQTLPTGAYSWSLLVDSNSTVNELNEMNNLSPYLVLSVTNPPPPDNPDP